MKRISFIMVFVAVMLVMNGCDKPADRTIEINQIQTTETYMGQFQIDTSQLPPDAIHMEVKCDKSGEPVTRLTIDQKYAVKIVLVPVEKSERVK
jgi:hypothetical protein